MNRRQQFGRWMAVLSPLIVALIFSACSPAGAATQEGQGAPEPSHNGTTGTGTTNGSASNDGGYNNEQPEAAATEESSEYLPPATNIDGDEGRDANSASGTTGGAGGGPASGESGAAEPNNVSPATPVAALPPLDLPPDQQLNPMTAGEIDDNSEFSAYLQYRLDYASFVAWPILDLDISERYILDVMTKDHKPVLGAKVTIYGGQNIITTLQTPATGLVYFFPRAYSGTSQIDSFTVTVERDQTSQSFNLPRNGGGTADVILDTDATRAPVNLDVMFLIDSTGSMGDEIDQLKNNILSISAQIAALPSNPNARFGMVTYRDHGDSYVTQATDFTANVQQFQQALMNVYAAGGGDDPEALQEGLASAIYGRSWRGGETVQLVFLVADAPPHLDYAQDYPYNQTLIDAAKMGIKIEPIASRLCEEGRDDCAGERRGYSEQAEYIFRQMAQFTGGHFIFLTYSDTPQSTGESGSDTHTSEGSYSVQDLDALVVRLITDELAALNGSTQQ